MLWAPVGVAVFFLLVAVWLRRVGRARFCSSAIGESAVGMDDLWASSSDDGADEDIWAGPTADAPLAGAPPPVPAQAASSSPPPSSRPAPGVPAAPPPAPAARPMAAGAAPARAPGRQARRKCSAETAAAAPLSAQGRRRAVAYEGKLEAPTRIYVGDSASVLIRLRNLGALLVRHMGVAVSRDEGGDSHGMHVRVNAAGIEHKELEIELVSAGAAVAGQAR